MSNFIYKDLNLSLIRHPGTSDVVSKYDIEAIKTAVRNILNTNKGEKLFKPEFGADLKGLLFELITPSSRLLIKRRIIEEVQRWEPRVIVDNVSIEKSNELGGVIITLVFSLRKDPKVQSTVSVNLERIR